MIKVCFCAAFLLVASVASAQTPIILGPSSLFAWDVPGAPTAVFASSLSYTLIVDGTAQPSPLANVTCVMVTPATVPTCSIPAAQTPAGSHSLTLTDKDSVSGVSSLPSTPFAYLVIAIPIPANLRFK